MNDQAMEQYLKKLKRALRCPQSERAALLSRGQSLLEGFLEETPEADYETFVTAFGPPEVFAKEMLDTLDQKKLTQARLKQKRIMGSVAALAAVAVLALFAAFVSAQQNKPKGDDIPTFIYGVEYPFFSADNSDPAHLVFQSNMPMSVVHSLLKLESVRVIDDPYFRIVDDPDDSTRKAIETNLPPEVVHSLLHSEQSNEP